MFWREGLPSTWFTDGCSLVTSESNQHVTTCECDHLTVFAALMDPYGVEVQPHFHFSVVYINRFLYLTFFHPFVIVSDSRFSSQSSGVYFHHRLCYFIVRCPVDTLGDNVFLEVFERTTNHHSYEHVHGHCSGLSSGHSRRNGT